MLLLLLKDGYLDKTQKTRWIYPRFVQPADDGGDSIERELPVVLKLSVPFLGVLRLARLRRRQPERRVFAFG